MRSIASTNAYYGAETSEFLAATPEAILGRVSENALFDIDLLQRNAWLDQIDILKVTLPGVDGAVFLEVVVPRLGSRIDAVVVAGPVLFVIEFKVGADRFVRDDFNQVWDYALDLKNFHRASHDSAIIPILVATNARSSDHMLGESYSDRVYRPARCNAAGLSHLINLGLVL